MHNNAHDQPALRFDHREIAVIFSLFVFVSLLMFTVGILVGKGLAQAKYEGTVFANAEHAKPAVPAPEPVANAGTSVTEGQPVANPKTELALADSPPASAKAVEEKALPAPSAPLKLIPEKPAHADLAGTSLQEPRHDPGAEDVLKNPKIKALLEKDAKDSAPRNTASVVKAAASGKMTASFAQGKFTVQVGSYPTRDDAEQRVSQLKKLGFPYAYFSAKELGDKKDTWYRVWLGYFPDQPSAEKSGRLLQERGEVKNYLVRKTDNAG